MTRVEWKATMDDFLNGVELELPSTTSIEDMVQLKTFRGRLSSYSAKRKRKRFLRELDAFLLSKSYLRDASERHIRKIAPPIIEEAVATLRRATKLLAELKANGRT
jgi:hypothetical protein